MKRKMDLLERAHGLLCNEPGDSSAEWGEEWRRLRADWIRRWEHLIDDQRTKERNHRTSIGNAAIEDYERRGEEARRAPGIQLDTPMPVRPAPNLRIVGVPGEHGPSGLRVVDLNDDVLCAEERVLDVDGRPLGSPDGTTG